MLLNYNFIKKVNIYITNFSLDSYFLLFFSRMFKYFPLVISLASSKPSRYAISWRCFTCAMRSVTDKLAYSTTFKHITQYFYRIWLLWKPFTTLHSTRVQFYTDKIYPMFKSRLKTTLDPDFLSRLFNLITSKCTCKIINKYI